MPKNHVVTLGRPLGASLLFGGLLLAVLAAAGASWADLSSADEERDAKADLLERGVAASRRARLAPAAPLADPFVPADTATLAAAAVDANLRAIAATAGLSLLSNRADAKAGESDPAGAGLGTRIEDQALVEGPNEALQVLLAKLGTGTPAALVDALTIEPAEVEGGGGADPRSPRLRMSLTFSAYWRPRAGDQK